MSILLTVFHILALGHYVYALWYDYNYVIFPNEGKFAITHGFGGRLIFLTIWNMIVQSLFFWICLINDLCGSNEVELKSRSIIRRIKDFLHSSIGFPLALFVSLTFWGLYAIDRELVFPKALDLYFPNWLNHVMHTNILIFTVVELICSFRAYPTRRRGLGCLTVFMLIYLAWTFVIYSQSGQWVYPVMEVLNWPQRIAFFVTLLLFIQGLYLVGETLNKLVWGTTERLLEDEDKRD